MTESRLTAGIVHIGVGNFHRAHMARYTDDLFGEGACHDWAILGAGVRPADGAMREKLADAGLAHHGGRAREPEADAGAGPGSMVGFVPVEADNRALDARDGGAERSAS